MKLVMAIVSEACSREILDELTCANFQATLISTTGGFLRKGNATLLIGADAGRVDDLMILLATSGKPPARDESHSSVVTFVLDVQNHVRL